MTDRHLQPDAVAPLFVLVALVFAFAVASRFDALTPHIPADVHAGLLWAAFPLLLVAGYCAARIDHGPPGSPLWMRLRPRSLRLGLTLGFTYLGVLLAQTLEWELGPFDPSPPLAWPLATRAAWYAMFTFGMFFANYIATVELLVPVLRALTWPARRLPSALAVVVVIAMGLGLGWFALRLVDTAADPTNPLARARSSLADPTRGALLTVAVALLPILLVPLFERTRRK